MAAIVLKNPNPNHSSDTLQRTTPPSDIEVKEVLDKLCHELKNNLPIYSRPLFLRIDSELMMTGTFKVGFLISGMYILFRLSCYYIPHI